jgi:hypothetical protein
MMLRCASPSVGCFQQRQQRWRSSCRGAGAPGATEAPPAAARGATRSRAHRRPTATRTRPCRAPASMGRRSRSRSMGAASRATRGDAAIRCSSAMTIAPRMAVPARLRSTPTRRPAPRGEDRAAAREEDPPAGAAVGPPPLLAPVPVEARVVARAAVAASSAATCTSASTALARATRRAPPTPCPAIPRC